MSQIFSKSNNNNLLRVNSPFIYININEFKNLPTNDPLINYLSRMRERSKDITVNTPF